MQNIFHGMELWSISWWRGEQNRIIRIKEIWISKKLKSAMLSKKMGIFIQTKPFEKHASCEKSGKIKIAESSIFGTNILGVVPVVLKSQNVRHKLEIPYLKTNYQYCSHSQLPLFPTKLCTMEAEAKVKPHKARRSGGRGRAAPPVRYQQSLSCQASGRVHSGPLVFLSTRNKWHNLEKLHYCKIVNAIQPPIITHTLHPQEVGCRQIGEKKLNSQGKYCYGLWKAMQNP